MTPAATANGSGVPSLRILWGCVLAAAVLLALRKPWALHTPQFWAEDGSIFMTQDDLLGPRAFLVPYNGYLHLLPRLVAWIARHVADVAWWPPSTTDSPMRPTSRFSRGLPRAGWSCRRNRP
jgi:hypothetical protein